jgi:Uma2 family endonuclease
MNIQTKLPTTADEFLRWNEGREGKWDLVEGAIVDMMVKVSKSHAILCSNLLTLLRRSLPMPPYVVTSADFGVETATSVRYPDVVVDGTLGSGRDLAAAEPLLIAEVLSPSTMAVDFGPKAEEYKTVGSLKHYVVIAQDEARIWLWSRGDNAEWLGPELVEGESAGLELVGLSLRIPLNELYAGINLRPAG